MLIMDETNNFDIHCSVLKTKSAWNAGQKNGISKKKEAIPRYWITVNKEVIWDFPKNYLDELSLANELSWVKSGVTIKDTYLWDINYTWVADTIREYIDTPRTELLTKTFDKDKYGLTNILKKYDRRISKKIREQL